MPTVRFAPGPHCYAAIRLDPVMMVKHLDAQALSEAGAIRPKMYLAFINLSLALPFPNKPWYTFEICPIGPFLRAIDEAQGVTSDMCVPIFPNTTHPSGRPSARTTTPFPYDGCYHWVNMKLDMRIRARPEGFEVGKAVELPAMELIEMEAHLFKDVLQAEKTCLARKSHPNHSATEPLEKVDNIVIAPPSATPAALLDVSSGHDENTGGSDAVPDDASSIYSRISSRSANSVDHESAVGDVINMNIFGLNSDEDVEEWPLVHLWLDLPNVLKQEDIGSPIDLLRERDEIVDIIRRAHARNRDLPSLAEHVALHEDEWNVQYMYMKKTKHFRPRKLLRKLTTGMRKLFVIPYVPVWP